MRSMVFVALVLAVGVGLASVAIADNAGDEIDNETVELSNETAPIVVGVEWNASLTDAENETATVTFFNESEYQNDSANATVVLEDSIAADEGNITESEYNASDDGLENGEEYRVVLLGTDGEVDDAWIETDASLGLIGGSGGAAVGGIAVVGVIGLFVWLGRRS